MHWAAKKRRLDPWRDAVAWAWLAVRKDWGLVQDKPCTVQLHLPFRTNQRKDAHNYTGTVCKAVIDALVRAGAWPDDTPEWVNLIDSEIVIGDTDVLVVLTTR